MAKYINVDSINWWDDLFMKGKNDSGVWVRYRDVENLIRKAPAADVVEVVRCKDCIHAGDRDCPIDWPKNGEDYCSFGERRADNGTTQQETV